VEDAVDEEEEAVKKGVQSGRVKSFAQPPELQ
jgi:hypothetical protein